MGVIIGGEDYLNIEGLVFLLDSRREVISNNNQILTFTDLSGNNNNYLAGSKKVRDSSLVNNNQVKIDGGTILSDSVSLAGFDNNGSLKTSTLKLLHSGQGGYGVYGIFKRKKNTSTGSAPAFLINTGSSFSSERGYYISLNSVSDRISCIWKDLGVGGVGISSPVNSLLDDTYVSFSHLNREPSGVNNHQLYIDGVKENEMTINTYYGDLDSSSNAIYSIAPNQNVELTSGVLMVFDWFGKTPNEIDLLHTQVMAILERDLNTFKTYTPI